jgi:O-antigen ligase
MSFGASGLLEFLPFVGSVEIENVTYRQQLLEVTLQEIWKSPWFGGLDIYSFQGAQGLRQHYGTFIDVVNTYVAIMLTSGLVGLSLFLSFFAAVGLGIYGEFRRIPDGDDERRLLGRALLATLVGILAIIFTVSSITVIPTVYWCVAGLGVAYAHAQALEGRLVQGAARAGRNPPAKRSLNTGT